MSRRPRPGKDLGTDGEYTYSATVLFAFWPEAEYDQLVTRWPHLAENAGSTWDEHRRGVERSCALAERAGHHVQQTAGNVIDFDAFLKAGKVRKPTADELMAYPDLRSGPILFDWPPGRTEPCWCGSGAKYKKCCRPYGLGTLD